MPDLMHSLNNEQRAEAVAQLVSFLSSTGQPTDLPVILMRLPAATNSITPSAVLPVTRHATSRQQAKRPTCHCPISQQYTLDSLTRFLSNPHAVRSSGLMPKLVANMREARDIACYLLGEAIIVPGSEQFTATVYHGTGTNCQTLQLCNRSRARYNRIRSLAAERTDNFAMVFEGYLKLEETAEYRLFLGSDDGSRLLIDGEEVLSLDGVHPFDFRPKRKRLEAGVHQVRIEYFEASGEERLEVEIEGPNLGRTPLSLLVSAEKDAHSKPILANKFVPAASLKTSGSQMFQKLGCAACHTLEIDGQKLSSTLTAPPLNSLKSDRGCLAEKPASPSVPDFALSPAQRRAIATALEKLSSGALSADSQVHLTMASFNCYACHSRNQVGGPEPSRDAAFTTTVQEMGNEARIPPP